MSVEMLAANEAQTMGLDTAAWQASGICVSTEYTGWG